MNVNLFLEQKKLNHKLVVFIEFIKSGDHLVDNIITKISGTRSQLKLSKDNKETNLHNFHNSFNETINKNSFLSNAEKIHYLLNLVTVDTLAAVKALHSSNSKYQKALDLLNKR